MGKRPIEITLAIILVFLIVICCFLNHHNQTTQTEIKKIKADIQDLRQEQQYLNETLKELKGEQPSRGDEANQQDMYIIAKLIHAEARGESFKGQVAVGAVVINRIKDQRFPDSVQEVIYAKGQFCGTKTLNEIIPTEENLEAAKTALDGVDPTGGAIYFYNPKIATDTWIRTRAVTETIGNHTFCI